MTTNKGISKVSYYTRIQNRGYFHYFSGLLIRFIQNIKYSLNRTIARSKGAIVGKNTIIPLCLAKEANANLVIGESTIIDGNVHIDLRAKVIIGNHVIINQKTTIIRASHDIDDPFYSTTFHDLIIDDFVWLCTGCIILHQVSKIGRGAVVGAYSLLTIKEVEPMQVVAGNPSKIVKKRETVHDQLVVESLKGGDFHQYWKCRRWFRQYEKRVL